jgi:uncharacterized protein YjbI with pentapeptide repeats
MKVGQSASLYKAVFEGPANFVRANTTGDFFANEAQFKDKKKGAYFSGMKVGQTASVGKAVFEGPVYFVLAEIAGDFVAQAAKFQNTQQGANFNAMKIGGAAHFKDAVFEGPVDFRYADIAWIDLSSPSLRKAAAQVDMQGMTYRYIRAAAKEPESHTALLNLANQSAYTADVYSNLEEFFKRQGYRAHADRAFIEGKCRERKEFFHSGEWFHWLGSLMLYLLVGYGRHPWQAGIPLVVLVALGCVLFSPEKMELQRTGDAPRVYNRFWYSLGLFLPVVDLQADKVWKPKADQTFLRNYTHVHALLGWILIPIILAALTGLIK